jgi:hypothetical protein
MEPSTLEEAKRVIAFVEFADCTTRDTVSFQHKLERGIRE